MEARLRDISDGAVAAMPIKTEAVKENQQKRDETNIMVKTVSVFIDDPVEIDAQEIYKRTLGNQ